MPFFEKRNTNRGIDLESKFQIQFGVFSVEALRRTWLNRFKASEGKFFIGDKQSKNG